MPSGWYLRLPQAPKKKHRIGSLYPSGKRVRITGTGKKTATYTYHSARGYTKRTRPNLKKRTRKGR